jgi:hypothetical protein
MKPRTFKMKNMDANPTLSGSVVRKQQISGRWEHNKALNVDTYTSNNERYCQNASSGLGQKFESNQRIRTSCLKTICYIPLTRWHKPAGQLANTHVAFYRIQSFVTVSSH